MASLAQTSNDWKNAPKNFQSLENACRKHPMSGSPAPKSSNDWNFSSKNFQWLELFWYKVAMPCGHCPPHGGPLSQGSGPGIGRT